MTHPIVSPEHSAPPTAPETAVPPGKTPAADGQATPPDAPFTPSAQKGSSPAWLFWKLQSQLTRLNLRLQHLQRVKRQDRS